jgi:hypothetical protein
MEQLLTKSTLSIASNNFVKRSLYLVSSTLAFVVLLLILTVGIDFISHKYNLEMNDIMSFQESDPFSTNCSTCPDNTPLDCDNIILPALGGVDLVEFFSLDEVKAVRYSCYCSKVFIDECVGRYWCSGI